MSFPGKNCHDNLYGIPTSLREGKTSKYEIITAIKTYLDLSNTQYAIMIDGEWGTGKTYFYKTEIEPLVRAYHTIYISLFGLKSIKDIEDEIFKAISLHESNHENNYRGILSLYPEILEDVKIGGSGYAVQFLINHWKQNSGGHTSPLVLCVDDLERWQGDLSICLSYINKLVEHENAKCILIGNLTALEQHNQKEFENAKDKTIGHIYKLENKIDTIFHAALSLIHFKNNKSSDFIKKLINENHCTLSNILNRTNHRNIRTISEAFQLFEYIFNKHSEPLTASKKLTFSYFCSLLATLILFKKYFISYELRDKLLNGYNPSNQGYAFLSELGYFDEDQLDHINEGSRFLLEIIFYRADKISLSGLFSIVKKGFYYARDFEGDFLKWGIESSYEIYLDSQSLRHLEDSRVSDIINDVLHSIFVNKEITNPATLLLLAEHITNDIKNSVIDLNFEQTKIRFIRLFTELYQNELIDKTIAYDLNFGSNRFLHCQDVYNVVLELNQSYVNKLANNNLTAFWLNIKNSTNDAIELFEKFRYEPIFSIYYNPKEVVDALTQLTNSQLFELVDWLNSRNHDPECVKIRLQEKVPANEVAEYINYSFKNKYGMQAGHLKNIAKLLMAP